MANTQNRLFGSYKSLIVSLLTIVLVLITSQTLIGRSYYFSTSIGNDSRTSIQAQNPATPWKSISKLNSFFDNVTAGDSILFKRGEIFYGSIRVAASGSSAKPIVIGAYGSGAKPVITGFTKLTSWTSLGNGIYQSGAISSKPPLNIVTFNGVNTAKGRYPNSGYLIFESHSGTTSITDNQLTGTPNWTGAQLVIRKNRYNLGRNMITNHTSNKITYVSGSEVPFDNHGYFIQDDPKTLDLLGEWYFNPTSKKLQVYFGSANPSSYAIKASTLDTLVYSVDKSYINFINLNFEGANAATFYINGGQNISVLYCGIDYSGQYGVYATSNSNFKIEHCSINHSNHNSLQLACANASVRYNTIKNSGFLRGMAAETGGYNGIELIGGSDGTTIEYNELDSIGKMGIVMRGNNVTVKNNLVNNFACFLDDVGGIYTGGSKYKGRKIIGNIVLNGRGDISGTTQTKYAVKGIFLEVNAAFIEITGNTVANCSMSGIHLNNSNNITINNNLCYNNVYQLNAQSSAKISTEFTRNLLINNNIFVSKGTTQLAVKFFSLYNNDVALFAKADNNYYCRPINDDDVFFTQEKSSGAFRALSDWQTFTRQDLRSKKSPQTVTNENSILFLYNASLVNKVIPLNAIYLGIDGTVFTSSITLSPYKSVVLIKRLNQTINTNLPPFIQDQDFQVNKNTTNGTTVGTVLASDVNVGQVLKYSIVSGNTSGAFAINATSGVLSVANSSVISAQTSSSYSLVVKVQDNATVNLSSQATITVTLISNLTGVPDINDQSFSIAENLANGTKVGTVIAAASKAGQTLIYSIVSGNTNGAFTINASTGILSVSNSSALNLDITPSFSLIVKVQVNGTPTLSNQANIVVNLQSTSGCSATGNITYQVWKNIGSSSTVSSLTSNINFPDNPTSSILISSMEGTIGQGYEYGARIVGYLCAPATGNYTFWIASDNEGELWLSTSDQSANKKKIAFHNGYTYSGQFDKYSTQKSNAISLVKGQKYYIEALMKNAWGGDLLEVGWLKPGQTGSEPSEIIPGSVLSPFETPLKVMVTSVSLPSTSLVNIGSDIMLLATVLPGDATNINLKWTSSNTAVATVNSSGLITGVSDGTATITATSTDGSNKSDICLVTVGAPGCSATGNITYQVWNNIGSSTSVSSLTSNINYPNNPTSSMLITAMEGTPNQADEYGARIVGYICAPATGNYTFWIASDDEGELWLSTNDQSANKQRIAYHTGYNLSRQWNKYVTQKSVAINLVKGQKYYIEALMKEATGGDSFSVGWLKPGQTGLIPSEIIPGSVLSPFVYKSKEATTNHSEQVVEPDVKLLVYPNPLSQDVLNIKVDNLSSQATLKIFTITGVECISELIQNSGTIHIDKSVFKGGIYIVKVFNEDFTKSTKLVVN